MESISPFMRRENETTDRSPLIKDLSAIHKSMGINEDIFVDNPRIFEYNWAYQMMDLTKHHRVLDAGCGSSPLPVFLHIKGNQQVTAIDAQTGFVNPTFSFNPEWKEKFSVNYARANIIDYRGMPFDYVLCISVLEHIYRPVDRLKAIVNLWENVKFGGRLIMTFDYMFHLAVGMQFIFADVGKTIDCVNYNDNVSAVCIEKIADEGQAEWLQQNEAK